MDALLKVYIFTVASIFYYMIHDDNPYLPIAMSLRMALERNDFARTPNVRIMVHEAKLLQSHSITVRTLTRSVYSYTTAINRYRPELVRDMIPEQLGKEQYESLLEFFESL